MRNKLNDTDEVKLK